MKIMWFCIPAFGHTNPTIEVVRELCRRGHQVFYYSFEMFREKITDTGAEFISVESYLPSLDAMSEERIRNASTTEMSVVSFEITAALDPFLAEEVKRISPDLVVSDSACFWGKLTAEKYHLPMVCSTTTFAFNQYSSKYTKYSLTELGDMVFGLPKVNRALKKLEPLGYHVKSSLDLVQNKPDTDTIVYTSRTFQPCSETFDEAHYCFVGPSVKQVEPEDKTGRRPFVYISLGTVIVNHPEFYRHCFEALKDEDIDVLISCGTAFDRSSLGTLPEHISVEPYVNQMEVLAKSDLFLTHCGMNSASEGLYMGVPELLFPITGEQQAVARRVKETGAGRMLEKHEANDPKTLRKVILEALNDPALKEGAQAMRQDFLSCSGPSGAADFIESRIK